MGPGVLPRLPESLLTVDGLRCRRGGSEDATRFGLCRLVRPGATGRHLPGTSLPRPGSPIPDLDGPGLPLLDRHRLPLGHPDRLGGRHVGSRFFPRKLHSAGRRGHRAGRLRTLPRSLTPPAQGLLHVAPGQGRDLLPQVFRDHLLGRLPLSPTGRGPLRCLGERPPRTGRSLRGEPHPRRLLLPKRPLQDGEDDQDQDEDDLWWHLPTQSRASGESGSPAAMARRMWVSDSRFRYLA